MNAPVNPTAPAVNVPVGENETVRWADIGSERYRDRINGVMHSVHERDGNAWIVRYAPTDRTDTNGTPVMRSEVFPVERLNDMWGAYRVETRRAAASAGDFASVVCNAWNANRDL